MAIPSPSRQALANAIRILSMDAVQQANSGHPGAPMGMADIAEVLWRDFMQHNPANPNWINRDRFILSNGHGSMLLYSLLHLTGYDVSTDDLKNFRQLHSKTPGHPEYREAPGVETTTGPLGQGLANAVGMALAERTLAAQFNQNNIDLIDHYTYVFAGDGCLMEGISHEACALAGTWGLGKLICFYDNNGISIDGDVQGNATTPAWFTDDTRKRFEAYGWHVVGPINGHDSNAIAEAINTARSNAQQPSLIICDTIIGFGAPNKQGGHDVHGAPLGADEIQAARKKLNWELAPFEVSEEIYQAWSASDQGANAEKAWLETFNQYQTNHPDLSRELLRRCNGELPDDFTQKMAEYFTETHAKAETIATRKASLNCLNKLGSMLPELLGGSADLAVSNLTFWNGAKGIEKNDYSGNYLYYGVREFGMSAIVNGIALHGGFIPYGATFLVFMDYARNAVRLSALMKSHSIFVFTHDSIGLGEDGPTHQPIEHVATLRYTPGMRTWRPCDAVETVVAWQDAIENNSGPTSLILSRQNLAHQARNDTQLKQIRCGGYILHEPERAPEVIVIATGSEVELAMSAAKQFDNVRVVSMPSTDLFDAQNANYKETVLPAKITKRLAIEALHSDFWFKYVGLNGKIIGMQSFGASAPAKALFEEYGFTTENIVSQINKLVEG